MEPARELLGMTSSELGRHLRYGLVGLRAGLASALRELPGDPGAQSCHALIAELDAMVVEPEPEPEVVRAGRPTEPDSAGALAALLHRQGTPGWLREPGRDVAPDELWRRLHLAALRMPGPEADRWRALLAEVPAPAGPPDPVWRALPGERDAVLVPPAGGGPGLRMSRAASGEDDVAAALAGAGPGCAELAALASTVVVMAEVDPDLLLALESVRYRGIGALDEATRSAFRRDVLDRLAAHAHAAPGSPARFRALVLLDEVVQSIFHLPVAAPGSWWAELSSRSHALVFAAQGDHPGVEVQLLARPYRESKAMTGGNDIRHPLDGSGAIVRCLRLWARVEGETLPGRVIYAG